MVISLFRSDTLSSALHVISQGLLIPVIVALLLFFIYAVITVGSLIYEYYHRAKINIDEIEAMITSISDPGAIEKIIQVINHAKIPSNQKDALIRLAKSDKMKTNTRKAFAQKLVESEEIKAAKKIEKTDIVTRLGPTLGLMGTLIPMGPGLAALGGGNVQMLAQAIIIAFDTTVVGLAAGGLAYVVSKIRRRWYEDDLSNLEVLMESILDIMGQRLVNCLEKTNEDY